jgi:VanZ family protein
MIAWLLAFLWMAVILYTSSLGQAVTPVQGAMQTLVSKLGHVTEYAILGGLLALAVRREVAGSWRPIRYVLVAALIGGTFAAFDELRQSFVPGREPRVTDVLLDLASVTAGALVATWRQPMAVDPSVAASAEETEEPSP